jgi:hypothetical protein
LSVEHHDSFFSSQYYYSKNRSSHSSPLYRTVIASPKKYVFKPRRPHHKDSSTTNTLNPAQHELIAWLVSLNFLGALELVVLVAEKEDTQDSTPKKEQRGRLPEELVDHAATSTSWVIFY